MPQENQFLALLKAEEPTLKQMLPEYIGKDRWFALAYEVSRSAALQKCASENPASLIAALKKVADWGLELDGEECVIIPYWDSQNKLPTAEAQSMYRGLIRRAIEAGVAAHIYAELVREGERIEIISGSHRELKHVPNPFAKAKIIGAYAVAILGNGLTDFETFNEDDIESVKKAALRMNTRRNKDAGESPAWRFFEGEMIKKSVIRRLCKRLRGKRDSDAGERYGKMLGDDKYFDAETTAQFAEENDDLPGQGKGGERRKRSASTESAPPTDQKPAATPPAKVEPPPPPVEDREIPIETQDDLIEQASMAGMKASALFKHVKDKYGVPGLEKLKNSQAMELSKELQAKFAGASK